MSNTYLNQALFLVMNGLICSGTASNSFCEIKVLDETFQMCVYVWRSQPFFIQNIQRKEEAMIIFTSLLTQRLFLCSMIFLERLRKNPAKPIEIKYISYFLQPSSLLFVYLMKALLQKLILFTQMFSQTQWYIGLDLFSYLIIFVQKYTNQRNIRNEGFSFQFAIFYRLSILMIQTCCKYTQDFLFFCGLMQCLLLLYIAKQLGLMLSIEVK